MRARDIEPFVGLPHSDTHDCADLALAVQRTLFARPMVLPQARPRPHGCLTQAAALARALGDLAEQVDMPADGDLILMADVGHERPGHVGTYLFIAHEAWCLHTTQALGYSCLHRVRDLPAHGLRVCGFYRPIAR